VDGAAEMENASQHEGAKKQLHYFPLLISPIPLITIIQQEGYKNQ